MNEHNHETDNSLRIYGTCPGCDLFYQKLLLETNPKDESYIEQNDKPY